MESPASSLSLIRVEHSIRAPMKMQTLEGSGVPQPAAMIRTRNGATVLIQVGELW